VNTTYFIKRSHTLQVHQLSALAEAGVTDVVLAVNYRPDAMTAALKKYEEEFNIKIHFSIESEPLGTAGPLKLAEKILGKDNSPFFVLNSDVICEYPFTQLAAFHKKHGDEGTIVVTKVEEPSKYGVVVHAPNHASRIERFVEKPIEYVGNRINAGIYILNPSVLDRIELRPTSIEQETFPSICADGQLHSFDLEGQRLPQRNLPISVFSEQAQPKEPCSGLGTLRLWRERHVPRDRENWKELSHWAQRGHWSWLRHWRWCETAEMRAS
jgi:NDP-sugar pyrophosphorylase family protein